MRGALRGAPRLASVASRLSALAARTMFAYASCATTATRGRELSRADSRMEERELTDDDWAALRSVVPAYAPVWDDVVAESSYDPTLPFCTLQEFAGFVVRELVLPRHDLTELGETLEALYTQAMIRDDESLEGLLTVGFLENLISEADELGLDLTRIEPILVGPRTRDAWDRAIAWERPDHVWERGVGAVPEKPPPRPVGTVELHRARVDREAGVVRVDVRLISGRVEAGFFLRRQLSKGFYSEWEIRAVRQRSPELAHELELELVVEREEAFEDLDSPFSEFSDGYHDHPFWQIAEPVTGG